MQGAVLALLFGNKTPISLCREVAFSVVKAIEGGKESWRDRKVERKSIVFGEI